MTNRFTPLLRWLPLMLSGSLLFLLPAGLYAQTDNFNFNYAGPTTVAAGPNCTRTLASAINPLPTVTSTIGATITMSMQDPTETTGNFGFNDLIPAPYTLAVGWLVKDNMGNSAHFYFSLTIKDLTPPVFDLSNHPATLNLGSVVQVPPAINPPVSDNCTMNPNQIVVTFGQTTPPDTCAAGSYTRTWQATDLIGNSTTFTQTINITADLLPPVVGSPPQNGGAPCAQVATAYPAWLAAQFTNFIVSDVSGLRSVTSNAPAAFPAGCAMPLVVIFRATDNCSFFTTRTATFTTSDLTPPIVQATAKDTIGYCSPANDHLTALGKWINKHGYQQSYDSCTTPALLTYSMKIGSVVRDSAQVVAALLASYANGCSMQMVGGQTYNKVRGKVTVNFFVNDACGNQSNAGSATFGVIDTLPPVITGVNKTEECGGGNDQAALNAWINAHGNATVTDGCSGTTWLNFSFITSTGQTGTGTFNNGPYPTVIANNCTWYVDVTFRVTDDCGNIGSKVLRFSITDLTPPVIGGFTPIVTIYCPNIAPTNPTATVTDNCDAAPTLLHNAPATTLLNCSGNYDVKFTWTATDDCGNTSTALQTFQVRDTSGPVFTLVPGPKTFRCDTFVLPPPVVKGVDIDVDDECSVAQTNITTQIVSAQNPNPAVCGHYAYQITRIFTATDDCGNSRTAIQVLSIIDNQGPVPAGTLDTTVVCQVTPVVSKPRAIDACSGQTAAPVFLNQVITPGPCDNTYLLTLNWQALDACDNITTFTQTIHVQDTMPPTLSGIPVDITVECNAIPVPPPISSISSADNCDQSVTVTFAETEVRDPDPTHCAHWANYLILRTWTATDNCGNTRAYTQTIHVEDHTPPVLTLAPALNLSNDPGDCGATIAIPAPLSVFDLCSSTPSSFNLRDTTVLVSSGSGPITTTPVDTVVLQWAAPNALPFAPVVGPVSLTINLDNVDSESSSERFTILGEGNVSLGLTALTPTQCGSSVTTISLTANQFNAWLADGQLTLRLAPNGTGGNAANAICTGGRARATFTYQAAIPQVPVTVTYQLDNQPATNYPAATPQFFSPGIHTILYTATDCAGNSSTASMSVTVQDAEAPVITPPAPITAYVGTNNCLATVTLPFPVITENCAVAGNWNRSSVIVDVAFKEDPNAGTIPKNTFMNLTGLIPNAVGPGKVTIRHKGDNEDAGEFFTVYDENNTPLGPMALGNTTLGPVADQCSQFHESTFPVTAVKINAWAGTSGNTFFKAVANNDVLNYTDFISPCTLPLLANTTDGVSQLQATLEYNYARVNFEITKGGVPVPTPVDTLKGNLTTVTLPPGVYIVKYRVSDNSGLEGMTSFTLTVRDTVKPKAFCSSTIIFTNPSGLENYILNPAQINNNSVDNCSGTNLAFSLSPNTFTCNQAPSNYTVTLTVTDTSGNSATCTGQVRVETTILHPTYTPVCEHGALELFADSLLTPNNMNYTYMWKGANNFVSNKQNPVIPNATSLNEGTYSVTITGVTGCTATGNVIVVLLNLPTAPVLNVSSPPYCLGSNIILSTNSYNGQNVNYLWYEGDQASSTLLATTLASSYTVIQPTLGTHRYFVKVTGNGCSSVNSEIVSITVFNRPMATVEQSLIVVCAGQPINLGTTVMGPGLTYAWSGPVGFTSTLQYPQVTASATAANSGPYSLTVTQNGCMSEPATSTVTVKPKPAQPHINGTSKLCEGATLALVSENTGSGMYLWTSPHFIVYPTTSNFLNIPNIMVADSGKWTLRIDSAGCSSDQSPPFRVQVQRYPDVTASSNSPLCLEETLQLTATASLDSLSWAWSGPGNFIRYVQNPTRAPGVPGQYKVVGKTSFGCADSAFVDVVISPKPIIDSIINDAPVCVACNADAHLQAIILGQYGTLTYMWTGPGGYMSSQQIATIPGVCDSNNGTYRLTVVDTFGCPSLSKETVLKVQKTPLAPMVSPTSTSVCTGDSVNLQVMNANQYFGNYIRYCWITPQNDTLLTIQPTLHISQINNQTAGTYKVFVQVDSCRSPLSTSILVQENLIPNAPTATSPDQELCAGETLHLFAEPPTGDSYQYQWISIPPGYTSLLQNPSVPGVDVDTSYTRSYKVRVSRNGCTSAYSLPVQITVHPKPEKPFLQAIQSLCLNDGTLILNVAAGGAPGTLYQFFNAETNDTLGPFTTSRTFQTTNLGTLHAGTNAFYVVALLNGCKSVPSELKTVQVDMIPVPPINAYAGSDFNACADPNHPLMLNADNTGSGTWMPVSGPPTTINNPNSASTLVLGIVAGNVYEYRWALSNGACKNYSADTVKVTAVNPEVAMVCMPLKDVCDTIAQLCAVPGTDSSGHWTQVYQQAITGVIITDSLDPNTTVRHLTRGLVYSFYWHIDDTGCGATTAKMDVRTLSEKPYIVSPVIVCSPDGCTDTPLVPNSGLASHEVYPESGQWSSENPDLVIIPSANGATANICNLQPGNNIIYWTTNGGQCGADSKATVIVQFGQFPITTNDVVNVPFGEQIQVDVTRNDTLPPNYTLRIVPGTGPTGGNFTPGTTTGTFLYQPYPSTTGTDQVIYEVCNTTCLDADSACSRAILKFVIGAATSCVMPTLITPNDDNINDKLEFPCLNNGDGTNTSELTVFNQWGNEVYHARPYLNDWKGTYQGEDLPAGTYFYILSAPFLDKVENRFLIIQR